MCCTEPGTKQVLNKMTVAVLLRKCYQALVLERCAVEGGGLILSGTLMTHGGCDRDSLPPGCVVCSFTNLLPGFLEQTLSYVNSAMTSGLVESLRWG